MISFEPPSQPKPKRHRPEPPVSRGPRYTLLISLAMLLLGGALWLWQSQSSPVATRGAARAAVPSKLSAAPSKPSPERVTKNIEDVRLGDWVLARNPELAAEDRPPELDHHRPDSLRSLSLRLQKEDGSWLDLQLLRSPDWLEEHQQGNAVYVDLEELGAKGWADLLAVEPCPAIGPRPHPDCRLVTGRFIHQSADTFDLTITDTAGETSTTIGLTDNHPVWSVDRQQFVPAGSLTIGERLTDTRGETLKVGSIEPRAGPEPVYNLEVDVEHVYFVSDAGLLVHNKCEDASKFDVGPYNQMKGRVPGLNAHHVGQSAAMKNLVKGYKHATAPTILVPKSGHTVRGPRGIVSRSTKGLDNARDVVARDIRELRRVYPEVPLSKLKELIAMNKKLYPEMAK